METNHNPFEIIVESEDDDMDEFIREMNRVRYVDITIHFSRLVDSILNTISSVFPSRKSKWQVEFESYQDQSSIYWKVDDYDMQQYLCSEKTELLPETVKRIA